MGVLGLTPFLQKHCPQVIHKLSNRLRDLAGKRLVIDGTLITQRLHYAPSPHASRHVLGWYHLAREMNESGISAVCIFDGQQRNQAKADEIGRRRETRRLDVSRGNLELLRSKRLQTLQDVMVGVRSLDEKGKSRIAEMLVRLNSGGGAGPLGAMEGLQKVGERLRVLSQGRGGPFPLPDVDLGGEQMRKGELVTAATTIGEEGEGYGKQATTIGEEEEYRKRATTIGEEGEGYREEPGIPAAHPAPSFDALQLEHQVQPSHRQDSDFTSSLGPPGITGIPMIPLPSVEDLKTTLLSSYREFRSSISRVVSLPFPSAESTSKHRDETTTTPVDESRSSPEEEDELVLSKTQCELTLEEGRVWDELTLATTTLSPSVGPTLTGVSTPIDTTTLPPPSPATPLTPPTPPTPAAPSTFALDTFVFRAAEDRLDALRTRSEVIADSYQRRMCAPTRNTYLESKEILEAMGVLCHEIEGEPHEGEALASSLVLRGLADYVVSEDSDVLVYGAPMIRNFTVRSDPLVLIHGSDVRDVLELSADAYIDFMLLLGTDFSQRIKNVGPSRAYKFIKEHGTIENILDSQSKYEPKVSHADYMAQVDSARAIFRLLPPVPDRLAAALMDVSLREVDQARVSVVMERCGLGKALMHMMEWNYQAALAGNYFDDNPGMILS